MQVLKPFKGFEANPLMGLPRNEPCYCGSEKKFKKCCLPALKARAPYVKKEIAEHIRLLIANAKAKGKIDAFSNYTANNLNTDSDSLPEN